MADRRKSLHFGDALRHESPARFSAMVKPAGALCNLACSYCYYLDKAELYDRIKPMDGPLLEKYISQYIAADRSPVVTFSWHGGEPLMAGLDFYEEAMRLQRKYSDGRPIENNIQTNGTLMDEKWCEFFRRNNFLVGISIDGPQELHDAHRRTRSGAPTFDKVRGAVAMMAESGVEYNTLSTVSRLSEGRGAEVYSFLKSIGSRYMQFLPIVEYTDHDRIVHPGKAAATTASQGEWSVSGAGYGQFMNDIFDRWVTADVGSYFVQMFDATLAQWMGMPPSLCSLAETCGDCLVVEHNGDVYSCDHFVYPEFRLGNINDSTLAQIYKSKEQFRFGLLKRNGLPRQCLGCKYYAICRGGCPKHRFDTAASGEKGLSALCGGYTAFFRHTEPYMKRMAELLRAGRPAFEIIPWARQRMGLM